MIDKHVQAVLAAHQIAIAAGLATAASSRPKPTALLAGLSIRLMAAGAATFDDPEQRRVFEAEIRDILGFAEGSVTGIQDRPGV